MPPELEAYLQDKSGSEAGATPAPKAPFAAISACRTNKAATLYLQFVPPSELCR